MDHAGVNRHSVKTENRNASMNTKAENIMGGEKGENLITKRELACRLKRAVRTITNWQRRGIIPYVRWRHAVYFDWHAVQASLQPRQGLLDFEPAQTGRRVAESEIPEVKGPVRLPVYQMRDETKTKRKCRSVTGRRAEATGRRGQIRGGKRSLTVAALRTGSGSENGDLRKEL